jgi:3-oxoacyl-[acyl-carrier-protein] synthase-1
MSETALGVITGVGARSPLGLDALQVTLCARAGKIEPRPTAFLDSRNYPIGDVRALCLRDDLHGFERLVELAVPALREAAATLGPRRAAGDARLRPPILLTLPEAGRADDDARLGPAFVETIAKRAEIPVDLARSEVIRAGHAGFAIALARAAALLREREVHAVLVGGVDSYHHPGVLASLDEGYRLHAPAVSDGFVPSEGAAFVLLEPLRVSDAAVRPLARLVLAGATREETVATGAPNLAEAMTRLARGAAEVAGPLGWILTDINGERHRVREWTMVQMRIDDLVEEGARVERWVEELGDAGAATGALLAVLACMQWQVGCAPAGAALVALHSESPERGVVILEGAS